MKFVESSEYSAMSASKSGLSALQKEILAFVAERGYITPMDATDFTLSSNLLCDRGDYYAKRSARASSSGALRRLVERGLLVKIIPRYVGNSTVFVSPDNTDAPPQIKRKSFFEHAMSLPKRRKRCNG